ncbi:MAG TPA: glutamate cyclase domain-containing protein, partial [Acetobacteraceae bacterium]|nr:glutamate cyclase domain-containing protein [Acetobacteraceae bacterium]
TPPAGETDGPVGAALLAGALTQVGIPCRLATDEPCRATCAAALRGINVPLDVVPLNGAVDEVVALWRTHGVTHALSIERCGRSADGAPRNMRGEDIGAFTTPLDDLFLAGPWHRVAIGDGGNEIGMGSLPASLIGAHVAHGETIACATPADHLIVAGVSNWGAYALIAALAVLRDDWRASLVASLDPDRDGAILRTMVEEGPAVDGVTRQRTLTVDSLPAEVHHAKLRAIRAVVEAHAAR